MTALRPHRYAFLILGVFLGFRLLLALALSSVGPDLYDYMRWGSLADSGYYPFVNYWSEYPPLFPWSAILLYRLSTLVPALPENAQFWYALLLRLTMTAFDAGSVMLVYGIALRLGSRARATRTIALFAAGFVLTYAVFGWYDAVPLFFLLCALYLGLRDRYMPSAVIASIGFLIKLIPILIVPVIVRRIPRLRQAALYVIATVLTTVIVALPFVISGPHYMLAFVRGTLNRPTWNSLWAILDKGFTFGTVLPVQDRFSAESVGVAPASSLPWPIIHLVFLLLFLFIYTRHLDWRKPLNTVAFAALTINLFLLWSKGFSGQFLVYVLPFVMLLLPNWRGVIYATLLGLLWIADIPLAALTFASPQVTEPNWFTTWTIITRTAVLAALCLEYAAILFPRTARAFTRTGSLVLIASWIGVVPILVNVLNTYTRQILAHDSAAPAIDLIAHNDPRGAPIVLATNHVYRRLYPIARQVGETWLLPVPKQVPKQEREQWVSNLSARGPFWFVADQGDAQDLDNNRAADQWLSQQACKVDTQWAGSALVSRFTGRNGAPQSVTTSTVFGDQIELTGAQVYPATLHSGGTLCVDLNWHALKQPDGDYTVFVHLVDPAGLVVAQTDLQPQGGVAPTSQWKESSTLSDKHGLIRPDNLSAGDYTLRLGLYRSDDQTPLRVTRGDNLMPDALGINLAQVSVTP
jgi:hypothetical protein